MVKVDIHNDTVELKGHAENKVVCAMVTTMTVFLVNSISTYLKDENLICDIEKGYFYINVERCGDMAKTFYHAFLQEFGRLMKNYPGSFECV